MPPKTTTSAQRLDDAFPVDSYREAAAHLRRPFTPAAVKFKVQAGLAKDGQGKPQKGLIVAYIDARLAIERLNLVIPHKWEDAYTPTPRGLMCAITIDGLTRYDTGEGEGKGLVSDAFKRAAVKFGVGVSLYATPKMTLAVQDGHLRQRQIKQDWTVVLTPNGETHVRRFYEAWLGSHGADSFGAPLDHGDVEDAAGDSEIGEMPPEALGDDSDPRPAAAAEPDVLTQALLDEVVAAKSAIHLPDTPDARAWTRAQLETVGMKNIPDKVTLSTLKRATPEQARQLVAIFRAAAEHANRQREQRKAAEAETVAA